MYSTQNNTYLGQITFKNSKQGLWIQPNLHGLPPGSHGFHIHETPACGNEGEAAGPHLDPKKSARHWGPFKDGHLGDLPFLMVTRQGDAVQPIIAPRLLEKDLENHAIMIHAGGDNYSDNPTLGGGGKRIACGIVKTDNVVS
jgi:Cu-Zn family superoxide dismutase